MVVDWQDEIARAQQQPRISDRAGAKIFEDVFSTTKDTAEAIKHFSAADSDRLGDTREQYRAAHTYLALAFAMWQNNLEEIRIGDDSYGPDSIFHFAGHAFRVIGQLNRAADAYWRSGAYSHHGRVDSPMKTRSFAHAKICFADAGQFENSDAMHVLEWETRREGAKGARKALLTLWRLTSSYGTNAKHWVVSVVLSILLSTTVFEALHGIAWIHKDQAWTPWLSALYYSIVTMSTLGYGEFVPCHWGAQSFVVLNVLTGYLLLAMGVTILGRKLIAR